MVAPRLSVACFSSLLVGYSGILRLVSNGGVRGKVAP